MAAKYQIHHIHIFIQNLDNTALHIRERKREKEEDYSFLCGFVVLLFSKNKIKYEKQCLEGKHFDK